MFDKIKSIFKEEEKKANPKPKVGSGKPKKEKKPNKETRPGKEKRRAEEKEDKKQTEQTRKGDQSSGQDEERAWPNKVKAIVIVELMGSPEEHIKNTMQLYLERIKENKDMTVESEDLAPIEKKESFFLQFTELTITFKSVKTLIEFCFDYMPSSIEIIEPTQITYESQDLSDIINDLQAKLHQLDMIVKNLRAENKLLNDNGNLLLRNLILVALKEEMSIEELTKSTGINREAVVRFVDSLVQGKLVEEKKGKYKAKAQKKQA